MFEIVRPDTNIDFVGKRHIYTAISGLFILVTLVLLFTKGLNYGIDFTGGAEVQLKFHNGWSISTLRETLEKEGLKDFRIQQVGVPEEHTFMVRAKGDEGSLNQVAKNLETILLKNVSKDQFQVDRVDVVGPAAGSLLRRNAFLAMFYALLVILIYVAFRFDARYAPGAVIALFHDATIVIGVFILTGKQFDLTILAAILTLIGYSNNDTIIIFDRVRETLHNHPEYPIEKAVNRAVNETLGRTIMTSITTLLMCVAILVWGGSVLENFAFALACGIVVGAYSSVFIASALVIYWTNYMKKKQNPNRVARKEYKVAPEPKLQA